MFASLHTASLAVDRVQSRGTPLGLLARLRLVLAARSQRRALARLNDQMLADVGLTAAEAAAEADRPLWDVPRNWLR